MPSESDESPWWSAQKHADRRPVLLLRNRIDAAVRGWLAEQGFVLVDPPGLQRSPGNETHLHAFRTTAIGNDGVGQERYFHTSPEFSMKKLLAAGETKIASLGHVWRNRERGPLHAPEFTMLEWYRAGVPYDDVIADTVAIIRLAAATAGGPLRYKGRECDALGDIRRISVADAMMKYAGIDLLETMEPDGSTNPARLARQMRDYGYAVPEAFTWSWLFTSLLVEKIEPNLGLGSITILDRYPASEAALARRAPDDPRVSERFEVYACGVELANGFGELTDATEQRKRFESEMDQKLRIYGETYPIDEDFLSALGAMPPASGVALGFDRLVMLATGAPHIDLVQWVPVA